VDELGGGEESPGGNNQRRRLRSITKNVPLWEYADDLGWKKRQGGGTNIKNVGMGSLYRSLSLNQQKANPSKGTPKKEKRLSYWKNG